MLNFNSLVFFLTLWNSNFITFSEVNCKGPGADMSHRVQWEKKLSDQEVANLTNPASFIDQEGWLGKQPN